MSGLYKFPIVASTDSLIKSLPVALLAKRWKWNGFIISAVLAVLFLGVAGGLTDAWVQWSDPSNPGGKDVLLAFMVTSWVLGSVAALSALFDFIYLRTHPEDVKANLPGQPVMQMEPRQDQ